jgi:hypothetical protein
MASRKYHRFESHYFETASSFQTIWHPLTQETNKRKVWSNVAVTDGKIHLGTDSCIYTGTIPYDCRRKPAYPEKTCCLVKSTEHTHLKLWILLAGNIEEPCRYNFTHKISWAQLTWHIFLLSELMRNVTTRHLYFLSRILQDSLLTRRLSQGISAMIGLSGRCDIVIELFCLVCDSHNCLPSHWCTEWGLGVRIVVRIYHWVRIRI